MTRILAFFIVATASFVAGVYFGQTDLEVRLESQRIAELEGRSESLAAENARLKSQADLIRSALQTSVAALARIRENAGNLPSRNGELEAALEE
ncbi:MAG: hypothetical protein F4093_09890 [Gammaproteobacteria bacterium]|nr:hypothetical protein [Gammaproteobacteria bacterium]MYJ52948.1 hypothetical protein [Gammaproteobacteria bacterium]